MKIVRFYLGNKIKYGLLQDESIEIIQGNPFGKLKTTGQRCLLKEVELLAPCVPSKIVALGFNYQSHADEFRRVAPPAPLIFLKPATTVIGPETNIIYPPMSEQVDYEGELGVVIRKPARRVSLENSLDYVLGYICVNDVTARDLQAKDKQWTRAKGFDTFCPMGPCIETELDPTSVTVETYLNGQLKQKARTADLVHGVRELVSFISNVMTLLPGDVIATGTPAGIGPMCPGDTVEIKIDGIGTLRNKLIKE